MKHLKVVIIFVLGLCLAISLQTFSNPECFLVGKDGKVKDLGDICGAPSNPQPVNRTPIPAPQSPPTKTKSNTYPSRDGGLVSLPSNWKTFSDGSISPSPGILVPSLYDIDI
jgi:hypothetical protein